MTHAQRQLRRKWVSLCLVLVLIVIFNDFVETHSGWLKWLLLAAMPIVAIAGRKERAEATHPCERAAKSFDGAAWLKVWFTVCALGAVVLAIYAIRNSVDLFQIGGYRYFVLSFVLLLGPWVVVSERERFKQLGEDDNAT